MVGLWCVIARRFFLLQPRPDEHRAHEFCQWSVLPFRPPLRLWTPGSTNNQIEPQDPRQRFFSRNPW